MSYAERDKENQDKTIRKAGRKTFLSQEIRKGSEVKLCPRSLNSRSTFSPVNITRMRGKRERLTFLRNNSDGRNDINKERDIGCQAGSGDFI